MLVDSNAGLHQEPALWHERVQVQLSSPGDRVACVCDFVIWNHASISAGEDTQMLQKIGALSPHTSQPEMWYKYRTLQRADGLPS